MEVNIVPVMMYHAMCLPLATSHTHTHTHKRRWNKIYSNHVNHKPIVRRVRPTKQFEMTRRVRPIGIECVAEIVGTSRDKETRVRRKINKNREALNLLHGGQ